MESEENKELKQEETKVKRDPYPGLAVALVLLTIIIGIVVMVTTAYSDIMHLF